MQTSPQNSPTEPLYLTSRQLFPLLNQARRAAGLPAFVSFKTASTSLKRHHCPTIKLDAYHCLYDAAAAILIATRPSQGRALPTAQPTLSISTPPPPQHISQKARRAATAARRAAAHAHRAERSANAANARAARRRRWLKQRTLAEKNRAEKLAARSAEKLAAQPPPLGYITHAAAVALFNDIRRAANRPTIARLSTHYNIHTVKRLNRRFYYEADVAAAAAVQRYRLRRYHLATPADLATGEYISRQEFSALTGIALRRIEYARHTFLIPMLQHPTTGVLLIHAPSAAAHFIDRLPPPQN